MTNVDILVLDADAEFALTPLGDALRRDVPGYTRSTMLLSGGDAFWNAWRELPSVVQAGNSGFDRLGARLLIASRLRGSGRPLRAARRAVDMTRSPMPAGGRPTIWRIEACLACLVHRHAPMADAVVRSERAMLESAFQSVRRRMPGAAGPVE